MSTPVPTRVRLCPDGPMLLSGDVVVLTEDGREVPATRGTVAVCRCGRSARAPWCDGSHKLAHVPLAPPVHGPRDDDRDPA